MTAENKNFKIVEGDFGLVEIDVYARANTTPTGSGQRQMNPGGNAVITSLWIASRKPAPKSMTGMT